MQATTPQSSDGGRHQDEHSEASTSASPDGGVTTTVVSHTACHPCRENLSYVHIDPRYMKLVLEISWLSKDQLSH